jgi:hypothetical protein
MSFTFLDFAESSSTYHYTDVEEAITKAIDFEVDVLPVSLGDLSISSKGNIYLKNSEYPYKITLKGFESFLKILGIPISYAKKVSPELLFHNIYKLLSYKEEETVKILFRKDNSILSIVKSNYSEIPFKDLLLEFQSKPIKKIEISDELLKISFAFSELDLSKDGSIPIDSIFVGEFLLATQTSGIPLQLNSGFYKTTCQNSYIIPFLGKIVADYSKSPDVRLKKFYDAFECFNFNLVTAVFENFKRNLRSTMNVLDFEDTWRKLLPLFSEGGADLIFSIDETSRKSLLTKAKAYKDEKKKAEIFGDTNFNLEPDNTIFTYYDIADKLTTQAHVVLHDLRDQITAEKIGGHLLQKMIFQSKFF